MNFAFAVLFVLACLLLPDLYTHLGDRGYLTFALPGPLPQARDQAAPEVYHSNVSGVFGKIENRSNDHEALRLGEVFQGDAREPSFEQVAFALRGVRLDSDCAGAAWGQRLRAELRAGGCSQVVRGLYADTDSKLIGFVAILNMRDVDAAERIVNALDPKSGAGFVLPLRSDGPLASLGRGDSVADGDVLGHFVFLTWVQRFDRAEPPVSDSQPGDGLDDARVALNDARVAIIERDNAAE